MKIKKKMEEPYHFERVFPATNGGAQTKTANNGK